MQLNVVDPPYISRHFGSLILVRSQGINMDIAAIKDWLIPISTFVTLITASVGGWLSLREYRLKVQAEIRLAKSSELEADIELLKLFTEVMTNVVRPYLDDLKSQ